MADEPSNEEDLVPDDEELEAAKKVDDAMANIARGLNAFHKLGLSQDLVVQLVAHRAKLRWESNVDNNGVPTLRHWLLDPPRRKMRGSTSAARASQTQASKFRRQIKRLKTNAGNREAVLTYFDRMLDAMLSTLKEKDRLQPPGAATAAVTAADGGAPPRAAAILEVSLAKVAADSTLVPGADVNALLDALLPSLPR